MRQSSIAARNATMGMVTQLVNIAITLLATPYIIHMVGKTAYGVFLLAMSFIEMLELLRSAIAQTCTYTVASSRETGDFDKISRTLSAAILLAVIQGAVGCLILVGGSEWLFRLFEIPESLHWQTIVVLALAGLTTLVCFPMYPRQGILWGCQRHDLVYAIIAALQVIRIVVVIAILKWWVNDVVVVMAATSLTMIATQVMISLLSRRVLPSAKVRLRSVQKRDFMPLVTFGSFMLLTQLAVTLDAQGSKWIVGKILKVEYVTYMWVATMIMTLSYSMVVQVTVVLMPIASRYQALKDKGMLQETFIQGSRLAFMMAGVVLCGLLPQMDTFLRLWMRDADFTWLAPYATLLGCFTIVTSSSSCSYQVLQGLGEVKRTFFGAAVAMIGGISTMLVASGVFDAGFGGVVAGLCVGQSLRWIVLTSLAQRFINAPVKALAWRSYFQPALAAIIAMAVVIAARRWLLQSASWLHLLSLLAIGAAVYASVMLPFTNALERQLLSSASSKVRAKATRLFGKNHG